MTCLETRLSELLHTDLLLVATAKVDRETLAA